MQTVRAEVAPRWPLRLPGPGLDGLARARRHPGRAEAGLDRLIHVDGQPVVVAVEQPTPGRLLFRAQADREDVATEGIARMCFALGVDDDLGPFVERFRHDPLIGASVRARPGLRVARRPAPFEALAWAICEQLIEYRLAVAIERRIVQAFGPVCARTGLRDAPDAATLAAVSPARLQSMDLGAGRALALRRAAREVAAGRIDLSPTGPDPERGWRRLRAIPGIGAWTVEVLALHGQGRMDQLPAGDLAWLKLVGRLQTGNPRARVGEDEVRAFFAPYAPWAGLAAAHAMRSAPPATRMMVGLRAAS
jgi:3-methyladenine DNA glycosylase/8-oxoguanine DNA glycosylase